MLVEADSLLVISSEHPNDPTVPNIPYVEDLGDKLHFKLLHHLEHDWNSFFACFADSCNKRKP